MIGKKRKEGGGVCHFYQVSALQVGHKHNGKYDFIGGKSQKEGHEDHPIQTHTPSKRVKESGEMKKQAASPKGCVGQKPDYKSGGSSDGDCTPKDKEGSVKDGTDKDFSHLGTAVGRQFQGEGRGNPL